MKHLKGITRNRISVADEKLFFSSILRVLRLADKWGDKVLT